MKPHSACVICGMCLDEDRAPDQKNWLLAAPIAGGPLLYDPGNTLGKLTQIYAFLSVDEGGEGICAALIDGKQMPLITADPARLSSLEPLAARIARMSGKVVRLIKFIRAEEIGAIQPALS